MNDPKQSAKDSTFHGHQAILDVLFKAYPKGYGLGAADISKQCGFYREQPLNDGIVQGFLNELEQQKKVENSEQLNGKGGWRLTTSEYDSRK